EADDLGGPGELRGGDVPDPGGAVAEDGELADVVRAAADAPGPDQVPERRAGSKVAMTLAEARSRTGQPSATGLVPGEEDGEPGLAGAGAAVLAFPLPPGGLLRRHGDAGALDGGAELAGQRGRRERDHLPGGDE